MNAIYRGEINMMAAPIHAKFKIILPVKILLYAHTMAQLI